MESVSSTKMFQKSEHKENGKIIRWTEVHTHKKNYVYVVYESESLFYIQPI